MSLPNNNICRTCLTQSYDMKSIYSTDEFIESSTRVFEALITCASVKITKGDGLPEQICVNCIQEIRRAYLFRKLCDKSDATLRHYLHTLAAPSTIITPNSIDSYQGYILSENNYNENHSSLSNQAVPSKHNEFYFKSDQLLEENNVCSNSEGMTIKENSENVLQEYSITNAHKSKYNCKLCEKSCSKLAAHKNQTNHHPVIFKCNSKQFKSEIVLKRHKLSHQSEDETARMGLLHKSPKSKSKVKKRNLPRACTICNKTFRFHSNLERHKLIHTGEKPYLCNVCGKGFAQLSYLKIHSFTHTGEKPYKCQMCDRSFAAPGTLVTHVRTHTGERPHVCKICGKDFPQSGYLASHIRIHTGEKPIECKVCHRKFNQRGRLNIHMRIHSGEKPYSCEDCGRSFAVKGTLKKHMRTHTGEKPYICTICGQTFAQNGTLATHMKVHKSK